MTSKKKQHKELIDALKFTPREITVQVAGYGGEIVMGRVSREAYEFWRGEGSEDRDLSEYVWGWDWDEEHPDDPVPEHAQFCEPGSWHDCDDLAHESGAEFGSLSYITVTDDLTGETLLETSLDENTLDGLGISYDYNDSIERDDVGPGNACFVGQSIEKGLFFEGKIMIRSPFDASKLSIDVGSYDGWCLMQGVNYDGESVEDLGNWSTTGKSSEFDLTMVEPAES